MKKITQVFVLVLFMQQVFAQGNYWVKASFIPNHDKLSRIYGDEKIIDTNSFATYLQNIRFQCYDLGFLSTQYIIQTAGSDSFTVQFNLGNTFQINQLNTGNVPIEWLGNQVNNNPGKLLKIGQISRQLNSILDFAENNGYPFAQIGIDSILADSTHISARIHLKKNTLIYFDSIDFGGTAKVDKDFLQLFANFKPGMIYQEDLIRKLDSRLSELPYVQVVRPMGVYFYGNKAKPYVYINHRKASSFDGVIGFAPNSQINNKLVLTGDMNLKLANLFGTGKNFELIYRGYLNNSQDLQIKFLWPYFLKTRLALDYSFKLAKFDTTWLELINDIGLQYRMGGANYLKFYYQNQIMNSFMADTQFVKTNNKLPAIHDVLNNVYGLALRKSTLDYFINPRKGLLLNIELGAGTKKILPMNELSELKIYDSVQLFSMQYKFHGNVSYYIPIKKNWVLLSQVNTAIIMNQNLFLNELFRIGGLKTLKGFDEQSIFANKYLIGNFELRYLFQQNSGFMIFWNGAWYENSVIAKPILDNPWGAGVGMNIETGSGVFSLYYALGKQLDNAMTFQQAKIHFGFTNFF